MTAPAYNDTLVVNLRDSQLKFVAEMIQNGHYKYSDDGWDDLNIAMLVASTLMHIEMDDDEEEWNHLWDEIISQISVEDSCCFEIVGISKHLKQHN